MKPETSLEKLARLYSEEGFTKEQMAEEMFRNDCDFALVVQVSRLMDKVKG